MEDDELREQLLDAASRVFARQGYEGTRIADIVREAGLSTGAVYGRFRSKNDLLREAVIGHASFNVGALDGVERVADMLQRSASRFDAPLTLDEAVRLEAHVAARREPEVAARHRRRQRPVAQVARTPRPSGHRRRHVRSPTSTPTRCCTSSARSASACSCNVRRARSRPTPPVGTN